MGVVAPREKTSEIKLKFERCWLKEPWVSTHLERRKPGKDASKGGYPNVRQFMLAAALSMA